MHDSPSKSSPSGHVHVSWQGVGQVSGAVGLVQVAGHAEPHGLYSWFAGHVKAKKLKERGRDQYCLIIIKIHHINYVKLQKYDTI